MSTLGTSLDGRQSELREKTCTGGCLTGQILKPFVSSILVGCLDSYHITNSNSSQFTSLTAGPCSDPDTDRLADVIDQDEEVWCREFGGGVWHTVVGEMYMEDFWLRNLAQAEGTCNLRSYGGEWTMTTL